MKTHLFMRRFVLTLLTLFTTTLAWADDLMLLNSYTLKEYAEKSYELSSADDWNALADYVASGKTCAGLTFKMTANIGTQEEPITKTMGCQLTNNGNSRKRFAGTFDGDGHTLTVNIVSASTNKNYCAPFAYVSNTTIKNLHVAGTVTPSGQFGAGIVGSSGNKANDGDITIENCHVSVTINNDYISTGNNKFPNHGGFVGIAEGNAYFTNCWFDGAFIGKNDSQHCGGFLGLCKNKGVFTNCLFTPSAITTTNNGGAREFANYVSGTCSFNKSYYTTDFGTNHQGDKIYLERPTEDGYAPIVGIDGKIYYANKLEVIVKGYGDSNESDHWTFIASPLSDDNIQPTTISQLIGEQISTSPVLYNYDLFRFNQKASEGKAWENYVAHTDNFVLENGQGYLYASKDDVTLTFTGTFYEGTSKEVALVYAEGTEYPGWNLVGNPFTLPAHVNRNYYKMNDKGTGIVPVEINTHSNPIDACTGIMVKAQGANESITFSTSAMDATSNQGNVQIAVAQANTRGNNNVLDNAILSFNKGSMLGKMYFGQNIAKLYFPQGNEDYAIAAREKQGEMPMCFKATVDGQYTISVNPEDVEMSYLHLIDNIAGTDIDLLAEPSYTFSAKNDDYASRFRLVFSAQQNGSAVENEHFAYVNNGNIIVNGEGTLQIIDALGRELVRKNLSTLNSQFSTLNYAPGVYVLRLINGNEIKNQKIIIK